MRPPSSPSDPSGGLFDPIFTTAAVAAAVSDRAWLQAMLDVEAALAAAEARAGLVPADAARAVAACCRAERYDIGQLGREAALSGNPVIPAVRALTAAVSGEGARFVHQGATSQDILDTAAMLVARRATTPILADLAGAADALARLAAEHGDTVMVGRTLLQQALPVTFALKAAGWLVGVDEARARLAEVRDTRLAVQLGGASGTLASLGGDGVTVVRHLAERLGLAEPVLPWHTVRVRVAELGCALGVVGGVLGKVARDLALLAQTEVAEAAEPAAPGRGTSSTMPHKRNPVASVSALACAERVPGLVATLLAAMPQEHERAAGGWHAEWETLTDLLRLVGGAAGWVRDALDGLRVDPERMRTNLDATGGLLMAERVTSALAGPLGRLAAHDLVTRACNAAVDEGRPLRDVLLDEPTVRAHLTPEAVDAALDPAGYLGSAEEFVRRAVAAHRVFEKEEEAP